MVPSVFTAKRILDTLADVSQVPTLEEVLAVRRVPLLFLLYLAAVGAAVAGVRDVARSPWRTMSTTALSQCEAARYAPACAGSGVRSISLDGCDGSLDEHNGRPRCWTSCGWHLHDGELVAIANPRLGLRCGQRVELRAWTGSRLVSRRVTIVGVTGSSFDLELSYRASRELGASPSSWDAPRLVSLRTL